MANDWLQAYFPKEGYSIKGVDSWRNTALRPFVFDRERWTCWVNGCYYTATDLHEAIISRQDVRGWSSKRKVLIHTPYNCIAVCKEHHRLIPDKEEVFKWMVDEYGFDVVEWFDSLPFKGRNPVQGLIDYYIEISEAFRKEFNV